MVTKIYALVWLLVIGVASLFYFTSNFNEVTFAIFGFVFSTLLFAGLVAVLPWWVDKKFSWKY
jgi:Mg/Co/Ni transporter MgtE